MVTIFIMALATSFIIFTIPKTASEPQDAVRLKSTLERASDRARMIGTPTGLLIGATAYEVADWRGGTWQPVAGTRTAIDKRMQVALSPGARNEDDLPDGWPVIVFDPLGHTLPVELDITIGNQSQRLMVTQGGAVELEPPDA